MSVSGWKNKNKTYTPPPKKQNKNKTKQFFLNVKVPSRRGKNCELLSRVTKSIVFNTLFVCLCSPFSIFPLFPKIATLFLAHMLPFFINQNVIDYKSVKRILIFFITIAFRPIHSTRFIKYTFHKERRSSLF